MNNQEATEKELLYPTIIKSLQTSIKKYNDSAQICSENKAVMLQFLEKLKADGTSPQQQLSYIHRLSPIAKALGPTSFKAATKRDMERIMAQYRQGLKQASVNKAIECLKHFYRWLFDLTSSDPAPEVVRWLKREAEPTKIRVEDLWTEEEINAVITLSKSLRTKAMIALMYESGLRPGELRGLKIKDVVFNGNGIVKIFARGKMQRKQGDRTVPILRSRNLLRLWIENHPTKNDPHAWLWPIKTGSQYHPVSNAYFSKELKQLAKKVGITKPSHPYVLRHSALTKYYKEINTPIARKLAGHVGNSKMVDVYCHLGEEDVESSILSMHGQKEIKREEKPLCFSCHAVLDLGSKICDQCGKYQSKEAAIEELQSQEHLKTLAKLAEIIIEKAEKNPQIVKLLLQENK